MRSLCVCKILLDIFTIEIANTRRTYLRLLQNFYEISVSIPCKILLFETICYLQKVNKL